jgi:hypothetical protein
LIPDGPAIIVFNNTFWEKSSPMKSKQGEFLDHHPATIAFNNTFGEKSPPVKSKQGEILHRPPIEATGNDDGLAITVFNSTVGEMSSPVKSKHGEFFAPPVEVTGNDVSSEVQSRPIEVTGNDDHHPATIAFNNTFGEKSPPVKSKQGEILHRPPIEATGNDGK